MQQQIIKIRFYRLALYFLLGLIITSCSPSNPTQELTAQPSPGSTLMQTGAVEKPAPSATLQVTQTQTPAIGPTALTGRVVRFAHPWTGATADVIKRIAKEFSQKNPWKIRVETFSHGGETQLVNGLQDELEKGSLPGLIAVHPYLLSVLESDFQVINLKPFFNDPEFGFSPEEQEDFSKVFFEPFTIDEQMIGMPIAPQATVLFYNRTWGEELGFSEPPKNTDLFRSQTCEATFFNWQNKDIAMHGTGGWVINLNPAVLAAWYAAFGGEIPTDAIPSFNNPVGKEAFGYLWDINTQGCIWFAAQPDPFVYFADRYALLYAGTLDQVPLQTNWMNSAGSQDKWDVIGFPGLDGEIIVVDGPGLLVTAEEVEDQIAAWLFAKYLLEPEVQAKLVTSLFSLPVRKSAMDLLKTVKKDYPQWTQGAALLDSAYVLPVSTAWGVSQWVLQDAMLQLLQAEAEKVPVIMEAMDAMIVDLVGVTP